MFLTILKSKFFQETMINQLRTVQGFFGGDFVITTEEYSFLLVIILKFFRKENGMILEKLLKI